MKDSTKKILSFALASTIVAGVPVAAQAGGTDNETQVEEQQEQVITYVVREGDTLGKIAKRFRGNEAEWETIAAFNHMCGAQANELYIGQVIYIPTSKMNCVEKPVEETQNVECPEDGTYIVKDGDTLYCIVRVLFGLTNQEAVDKFATYNQLSDPNEIYRGQVLKVPCKEKLLQVQQWDYTAQYNAMGERLYRQQHPCQPCQPCIPCVPQPVCPEVFCPHPVQSVCPQPIVFYGISGYYIEPIYSEIEVGYCPTLSCHH